MAAAIFGAKSQPGEVPQNNAARAKCCPGTTIVPGIHEHISCVLDPNSDTAAVSDRNQPQVTAANQRPEQQRRDAPVGSNGQSCNPGSATCGPGEAGDEHNTAQR